MINVFNRVQQCAFWVGGPNVNFSVFSTKRGKRGRESDEEGRGKENNREVCWKRERRE